MAKTVQHLFQKKEPPSAAFSQAQTYLRTPKSVPPREVKILFQVKPIKFLYQPDKSPEGDKNVRQINLSNTYIN